MPLTQKRKPNFKYKQDNSLHFGDTTQDNSTAENSFAVHTRTYGVGDQSLASSEGIGNYQE